jgi:hypothetical protein
MLRQRLEEAQSLLERAEEAVQEESYGSDRWRDHHRSTLDRLSQLCEIMDDPTVPNGSVIQLAAPKVPSRLIQATRDVRSLNQEMEHLLANARALMKE